MVCYAIMLFQSFFVPYFLPSLKENGAQTVVCFPPFPNFLTLPGKRYRCSWLQYVNVLNETPVHELEVVFIIFSPSLVFPNTQIQLENGKRCNISSPLPDIFFFLTSIKAKAASKRSYKCHLFHLHPSHTETRQGIGVKAT